MTAPHTKQRTKVLSLPPPPSSKPVKRPDGKVDVGLTEVLGKQIKSNENVTTYKTIVSSSAIILERVRALQCTNRWINEGKYHHTILKIEYLILIGLNSIKTLSNLFKQIKR